MRLLRKEVVAAVSVSLVSLSELWVSSPMMLMAVSPMSSSPQSHLSVSNGRCHSMVMIALNHHFGTMPSFSKKGGEFNST